MRLFFKRKPRWERLVLDFIRMKRVRKDKKTVDWYSARLMHWLNFVEAEQLQVDQVTVENLDEFAAWLKRSGLKYNTRASTVGAIKTFFKWLRKKRVIASNPFDEFEPIPVERNVVRPIPLDAAYRMIRTAENDGTPYGIRDAAIMRILLTTGARREEVTNLNVTDIDLERGYAVLTGKYGHQRPVPLKPTTVTALGQWLEIRPPTDSQAVFVALSPSHNSVIFGELKPRTITDILAKWQERAGITEISCSPHKWRHRFASEMKRGGDPFSLQALMGHSDIATTQLYTHASPEELYELVNQYGPDLPTQEDD